MDLTLGAHARTWSAGHHLRVVNYHVTPRTHRDALRAELQRYAAEFQSLTYAGLDAFVDTGRWPDERPVFAPVFYEGYRTCYDVAAEVCDELGLTGWFPVCTGFVDCAPAEQEIYAKSHWIDLVADDTPALEQPERLAMSWDEVRDLVARGHVVFPHTASHAGMADVVDEADVRREIDEPWQLMQRQAPGSVPVTAWLWGSPFGTSPRHDQALIAAGYRYVVSNTLIQRIS